MRSRSRYCGIVVVKALESCSVEKEANIWIFEDNKSVGMSKIFLIANPAGSGFGIGVYGIVFWHFFVCTLRLL